MATLNDILLDSASTLDLSASLPTGDELDLRINYANQALEDAAATGQLPEFKMEYSLYVTSIVTVPLPTGFREFQEDPKQLTSGGWVAFPEIEAEEKHGNSDYWCYVMGNPSDGYNAIFNELSTGATLSIIYQRYPSGMVTTSDVCELSDPTFVTRKIESYVLYSRGDDRFQIAESRANTTLLNMIGRKSKSSGGQGKDTLMKFNNPLS